MLYNLGPITFDSLRVNPRSVGHQGRASFAKHDVIGGDPMFEAMGSDEASTNIEALVHPVHFGGMGSLAIIQLATQQQIPLPLMRGDYVPLGWFIIADYSEDHTEMNSRGIGPEVRVRLSLKRSGTPGIGMAPSILRLFQ